MVTLVVVSSIVAAVAAIVGLVVIRRRRAASVHRPVSVHHRVVLGFPDVSVLRDAPRRRGRTAGEAGDATVGGPFLHWVPDYRGGWRLAGDFLRPADDLRAPQRSVLREVPGGRSTGPRRRRR